MWKLSHQKGASNHNDRTELLTHRLPRSWKRHKRSPKKPFMWTLSLSSHPTEKLSLTGMAPCSVASSWPPLRAAQALDRSEDDHSWIRNVLLLHLLTATRVLPSDQALLHPCSMVFFLVSDIELVIPLKFFKQLCIFFAMRLFPYRWWEGDQDVSDWGVGVGGAGGQRYQPCG